MPDPKQTATTDITGWLWCRGPDGREGWVPEAWVEEVDGALVLTRDFAAMELTVRPGDIVSLRYAESGFVFCETDGGAKGWVPDGVLRRLD